MSTLKTNNIEHLDAATPSIQTTIGGGVVFAGLSTFQGNAQFDGNVNIAGTVTYDDVTNIDSVGVITARSGLNVGPLAGIAFTVTNAGVVFASGEIQTGGNPFGGSPSPGVKLNYEGAVVVARDQSSVFIGKDTNTGNVTSEISFDGSSKFSSKSTYEGMELITPTGDGVGEFQFGVHQQGTSSGRSIVFKRGGSDGFDTESLRITAAGDLCVGINTNFGTENENVNIASGGGGRIALLRNDTSISSGNELGRITWYSNDSTSTTYQQCAAIRAIASGTFGDGDKPTDLTFSTTPDNSATPAERVRITSDGKELINTTSNIDQGNGTAKLQVVADVGGGGSEPNSGNALVLGQSTNGADKAGVAFGLAIDNGGESTNACTLDISTASAGSLSKRMSVNSGGNVDIVNGNLVFETAGTGIDFSAAGNTGGMTSELLDDYEEGTWTPTLGGSMTLNSGTWGADGQYTKIGNIVTLEVKQTSGDVSWGLGALIIGGSPFTPAATNGAAGCMTNTSPNISMNVLQWSSGYIYASEAGANQLSMRINITFRVS